MVQHSMQSVGTMIKYWPLQVAHGHGRKCSTMQKYPSEITVPVASHCHHASPQPPYRLFSTLVSLRATHCTVLLLQANHSMGTDSTMERPDQHTISHDGGPNPHWGMAPLSPEEPELQVSCCSLASWQPASTMMSYPCRTACTLAVPGSLMPPCNEATCTAWLQLLSPSACQHPNRVTHNPELSSGVGTLQFLKPKVNGQVS